MYQKPTLVHEKVWITKVQMREVPPGFEVCPLGDLDGAIRQYRGPDNLHLHEYEDRWRLHYDYGDPRTLGGFIIHIFLDAPEVGISLLIALDKSRRAYDESNSVLDAILTFVGTGIVSYLGLRLLKKAIYWIASWMNSS
jgi:hypothetical protein